MNIHEFQAKIVLKEYGVPIPDFVIASSKEEAEAAIKTMGLEEAVIKVQVHAGGRGKAGGVKIAKSKEEILAWTEKLIGMKIINNQTGKEGVVAHQVLISPLVKFRKEFYIGAVIDRQKEQGVLIISPEGGVEIEEIAAKTPEKIKKFPIENNGLIHQDHLKEIADFMGWKDEIALKGKEVVKNLAKAFVETDASLLEINPLIETLEGEIVALDAKLSVDDNALYRQEKIQKFYDPTQIPKNEAQAKEFDLAYVALDGEIGCMVNGAGLAMATMDIIHHFGGTPANFLDVGGSATKEKVAEGFKIILSDPKVKAILVNIFGGIMNCETLASGIIAAADDLELTVPLIVRMEGTNVEQGKKILADSGLNIIISNDLADAAQKVVHSVQRGL